MNSDFNDHLYKQRAENSAEHAVVRFIAQFGQAIITTTLLWSMAPHFLLIVWFSLLTSVSICILFLQKAFTPDKAYYSSKRWGVVNAGCSFSIGLAWSLGPSLLFIPGNVLFIVLVVALYAGYVSGSLAVNFTYKYSFYSFVFGITTPFLVRLFYEGGTLHNTLAGLIIFYVTMLMYVSFNMHKLFIRSVEIEHSNTLLIEELANEKAIVERSVAAKDQFLAAASHDLRQPLNAISLFTDALKPLQSTSRGSEILVKIRQSLTGLNSMLHGLLDISRLDAEAIDNSPKHVSLKTVVDQLFEEYRHNVKKLEVTADVNPDIIVFVDPTILYRVLNNLLDNAVKYTQQGEISIVTQDNSDTQIDVIIKDSGVGIPKDKLALVFDEFQQLNNPERDREKGLGLGLAIVKRLCRIANIEIKIDSEVGTGTQVTLTLRRGIKLSDIETSEPLSVESLEGKYILVIDDEKDIREGMQYLLTSYGCEVTTADSLVAALDKLKQQTTVPDLIISDLRLRDDLTGDDAIDTIRDEYNKHIPAIIITGDTAPDKIIQAKSENYTTIYKPVEPEQLKLIMGKLLQT